MIARRIPAKKGSDFARLARYVVDAQGLVDPRTWSRTADDVLEIDQEKVGGVRLMNCAADDPATATLEILATQSLNKRSKSDKTYHLMVSFPLGERPSLKTMHAIEDRLCEAIGFADHQRLSAVHTDTDCLHMHIAINKVHPKTLRNVEPYYDQDRLMVAAAVIEIEYGLERINHGLKNSVKKSYTKKEVTDERDQRKDIYAGPDKLDELSAAAIRQSYLKAINERPKAQSINRVRSLSGVDMVQFPGGREVFLPRDAPNYLEHRGAERDDALRRHDRGESGTRGGSAEGDDRRLIGKAANMEAHSGRESLLGWTKREVMPAIRKASNWQELHRELARCGLEIKPRGAGLVIAKQDGMLAVKASQVSRDLAFDALVKRFGSFEVPAANVIGIQAVKEYRQGPRQTHTDTSGLFTEYQRLRVTKQLTRKDERDQLRQEHTKYAKELMAYYQRRREVIFRSTVSGQAKRDAYASLAAERGLDLQKRRVLEASQRAEITKRNSTPGWQEWLALQAETGDEKALAVLRSRERQQKRFIENLLTSQNWADAKPIVYEHMKPYVSKNGTVSYEMGDGGVVKDMREGVNIEKKTDASAFLALLLAADKYTGQTLVVEGSEEFKKEIARVAGEKGINVEFADSSMEQIRKSVRKKIPEVQIDPIDNFILSRNSSREKITSIGYHRRWTPQDAGEAIYQGRRRLADGKEALLLQRGDVILVLPADNANGKASKWRVGMLIRTDNQGRVYGEKKENDKNMFKGKSR